MATETSNLSLRALMGDPDLNRRLEAALRQEDFRRMLADYAREVGDADNRAIYEREVAQMERERGFEVTFLHPSPGYVLKTANLRNDEKVFVNVCAEENVGRPDSQQQGGGNGAKGAASSSSEERGVRWSIPFMQSDPRKDLDKGGRPCTVYDVLFHPDAIAMALDKDDTEAPRLKAMLTEISLDAVERSFGVKLGRENLKIPKMRAKGNFQRTVIRKPINKGEGNNKSSNNKPKNADDDEGIHADVVVRRDGRREPKYLIKYRQPSPTSESLPECPDRARAAGRVSDPCRPSHVVVEVHLPELSSAAGVDLDVTETQLSLSSEEPAPGGGYSLSVRFAYPVLEEEASARFDVGSRVLAVTVPVRPSEVRRLTSTDSGIDVDGDADNGYFACTEDDDAEPKKKEEDETAEDGSSGEDLLFPPYACNIYEDLMIFTLEVKRAEQSSLRKVAMEEEGFGFGLTFSSSSSAGKERYGFFCALVPPPPCRPAGPTVQERVEVEVWDNNVIVKVSLPKGLGCEQFKVGSNQRDLTIHNLPQLRALRRKKEKKMQKTASPEPSEKNFAAEDLSPPPSPKKEREDEDEDRERHSSGDSKDSLLSSGAGRPRFTITPTPAAEDQEEEPSSSADAVGGAPLRSILKKTAHSTKAKRGRCLSEQSVSSFVSDATELSSIATEASCIQGEEDEYEEDAFSSLDSVRKKSVRFDTVVQRKVFRPNASITGLTAKNAKKRDAKRKRAERRASEGDTTDNDEGEVSNANVECGGARKVEEESHNDSGLASSMDDAAAAALAKEGGGKGNNNKGGKGSSSRKGRKQKQQRRRLVAEAASDLIFDLDM